MIENSSKKKNLFYAIILLLTLIVMIIGATLAYYRFVASQKERNTKLYSGTLSINYLDGVYIRNPELFPMKNVTYETKENVYRNNFSIVSTGTLDQTININMIITNNTFKENSLLYALYNSKGVKIDNGIVPLTGTVNLASNVYLGHDETAKYTLIIWWSNTGYDQTEELNGGATLSGQMSITAKQIKY